MKTIMQNNNQNNQQILQSKLDELDHLPGEEAVSFDASWQKLELRMNPVRRRKRNYLYWIVAACLLVGILLPWVLNEQKPPVNEPIKNVSSLPALPAINKDNSVVSNTNKAPIPANTEKTTVKRPVKSPAVLQKQNVALPEQTLAIKPSPVQDIIPAPVVEMPANVTAVVVKKPIGIVHLNDLNDNSSSQLETTAGNENSKLLRFIKRTVVESSLGDGPDQRTTGNHILFKNIN